jgi:hypothetical protein
VATPTLSARTRWLAVAAVYVGLTLAYARTLLPVLTSAFPGDAGDPAFNTWILWWNTQATPLTDAWWNAPIFYPVKGAFALSETLLALWPITTPLQWAGASPLVAYNVVFLLSFPTAALAAHALAHRLTGRHDAAFIAGLAFGFAPFRAAQIWHMQILWTCWMPLGLFALHRFLERRRRRDLALFALCWLLNGLTTGYYLFFFAALAGLWVLWFGRSVVRDWLPIGIAAAAATAPLIPLLIGYTQRQSAFGMERPLAEIEFFSADLSGLWATMPFILPHAWTQYPKAEGALYPGIAIAVLAIVGVVIAWRAEKRRRASFYDLRKKTPGVVFLGAGLLIGVLAAFAWLQGGWSFRVLGQRVSLTHPLRAAFFSLCLLTAGLAWDARLVAAWRRRSPLLFYAAASVLMLLLALGPHAKLLGETFMADAPYAWLMQLPGGHALRVPARFSMLLALCLSITAAIAFARLTIGRSRTAVAGAICAAVLLEGFIWRLPVAAQPSMFAADLTFPRGAVALELPIGDVFTETAAMMRATTGGYTLVNGFSGYSPPHYELINDGIAAGDRSILTAFQEISALWVYVDKQRDADNHVHEFVAGVPGAGKMSESDAGTLYSLPPRVVEPVAKAGRLLRIVSAQANVGPDSAPLLFDGDLTTRWSTYRAQAFRDEVRVTLAEPATVTRVEMDLGPFRRDAPRSLRIAVIPESGNPEIVWEDTTAGFALTAALADPLRIPLTLNLASRVRGDQIVLRALSAHDRFAWSIAELRVFGE